MMTRARHRIYLLRPRTLDFDYGLPFTQAAAPWHPYDTADTVPPFQPAAPAVTQQPAFQKTPCHTAGRLRRPADLSFFHSFFKLLPMRREEHCAGRCYPHVGGITGCTAPGMAGDVMTAETDQGFTATVVAVLAPPCQPYSRLSLGCATRHFPCPLRSLLSVTHHYASIAVCPFIVRAYRRPRRWSTPSRAPSPTRPGST